MFTHSLTRGPLISPPDKGGWGVIFKRCTTAPPDPSRSALYLFSSLLQRFEGDCNAAEDPASPLAYRMAADDLTDSGAVAEALAKAARKNAKVGGVLRAFGGDIAERLKTERTFDVLEEAFYANGKRSGRPVCLLIDEAQRIAPACAEAVRKLHDGDYGLPVLAVFAGLNDTEDALKRCDVSWFAGNARLPLGLLAAETCEEAAASFFGRFRVAGDAGSWIGAIAEDSQGFPQHLHIGLQAAAEALADVGGAARREGLERARRSASAGRIAYYEARISPELGKQGRALVGLLGEVERCDPLEVEALHALAARHLEATGQAAGAAERDAFVRRLVRSGLLQQKFERTAGVVRRLPAYEVPIPSMKTWILEDYARRLGIAGAEAAGAPEAPEPRVGDVSFGPGS